MKKTFLKGTAWVCAFFTIFSMASILKAPAEAKTVSVGDVQGITQNKNVVSFNSSSQKFRVTFYQDDIVRIQMASSDGKFHEAKDMPWPDGSKRENIDMLVNAGKPNLGPDRLLRRAG